MPIIAEYDARSVKAKRIFPDNSGVFRVQLSYSKTYSLIHTGLASDISTASDKKVFVSLNRYPILHVLGESVSENLILLPGSTLQVTNVTYIDFQSESDAVLVQIQEGYGSDYSAVGKGTGDVYDEFSYLVRWSDGSPEKIGSVAVKAVVYRVTINVIEVFNGTGATIKIGKFGGDDSLFAAAESNLRIPRSFVRDSCETGAFDVYATLSVGTATQGQAMVIVQVVKRNN